MISQKHRFRGQRSIEYVYKKGRTARNGPFSIKVLPTKREDYRLAVVVSKKVSKSAVKRNRIRRRVFELFRKARAEHGRPIPCDIVITVHGEQPAVWPADKLAATFHELLASAGIGA